MTTIFIFILLTVVVSYFIALPIIQTKTQRGKWFKKDTNHRATELVERKESIYAAIKDIEFDYEMGKLSEEDFQELRQQYKNEAIGLLKKIDNIQKKRIKQKKLYAKHRKRTGTHATNFCWMCGNPVTQEDKFCVNCGNRLE